MGTQSQSAGALVGVAVVAGLAGCGGRVVAEADRVCTPLPAAATGGDQSTFPARWPAEMASLAWGVDHALYALGQWLQDGSVRRVLLRSTDLGTSFCVMPSPGPMDQLAAVDGSPIMFGITGTRTDQQSFRVWRSLDAGATWQRIDRELPFLAGPLTLAGVGAQGTTVWITDSSGGYWVSRDAGERFQSTTLASPTLEDGTYPITLLVDPELPGRAFVAYVRLAGGTIDYPVFRTDDAGISWRQMTLPEPDSFAELALARGSRLVYLGATRLWSSDDGGDSWRGGITIPATTTLASSGQLLSLRALGANGTWADRFSVDGGDTWYPTSDLPTGNHPPGEFVADPATDTVLAVTRLGLFRTRDRALWTSVHASPHTATDVVFAGGGDTLWVGAANAILTSRDRGASWTIARKVDGEVSLSVDPTNASRGLAVTTPSPTSAGDLLPARVLRTTDGGTSWQDVPPPPGSDPGSAGVQATIAADGTFYVSTYVAGAHGIAVSHDGGASFTAAAGRMISSVSLLAMAVDPRDSRRVWLEVQGGTLYESRDAGGSWLTHTWPRPPEQQNQWTPPRSAGIVFSGDAIVVAGPRGIARSADSGITWTLVTLSVPALGADGFPDVLALRGAPDGRLLTTNYNRLYASSDNGATWTVAVEIPLSSSLGRPAVDPARPGRVVLPFTQAVTAPFLSISPPIYPAGVLPWDLSSVIEVSLP